MSIAGTPNGSEIVSITPIANAVYDSDGNALSTALTLSSSLNALVIPEVTSFVPALGATNITLAATIYTTFSTTMDTNTLTTSTFSTRLF